MNIFNKTNNSTNYNSEKSATINLIILLTLLGLLCLSSLYCHFKYEHIKYNRI